MQAETPFNNSVVLTREATFLLLAALTKQLETSQVLTPKEAAQAMDYLASRYSPKSLITA